MTADPTRQRASRLTTIASASIAGLLLLVAGSFDANAATVTVSAADYSFQPASRSIHVGDVVRWTFAGDPHTVTSGAPGAPDTVFDSGIKTPGSTFQVTFQTVGTFHYFCQIHPEQMTGTIVVSAGSTPTPTQKPTVRPTARATTSPTATPTVTATSTEAATATAASTATATTASPIATASPAAAATISPSPSAAPSTTPTPKQSAPPGPDGAAAGTFDPVPALVLAIVIGLLMAGAVALLRRPRRPDRPI